MWYPIVLFGLLGVWTVARRRPGETLVLATFFLTGTLMYSAVEGNVGPALRHRSQFQFVVFAFVGIGISQILSIEPAEQFQFFSQNDTLQQDSTPADD